jgi:transposase
MDEIAHKKGRGQYMTIISDDENVRETTIGKSGDDISKRLLTIPNISGVKKVCMDMCAPFAKVIREAIPGAEIVLDRFHIMKLLNKKLWELNEKRFKKIDEKARKRFSEIRYLLSKDRRQLNKWEKRQVKDYLYLNKEIKDVYWKIQEFRNILFNYHGFKHGFVSQKLMEWIEGTRKYLGNFITTLEKWWDEVVNACIYRESNARQEGINNKIKALKRRGFGYRNWLNFEFRIYGECNP